MVKTMQVIDYQDIRKEMQRHGYGDVWDEYWGNRDIPGNDCGIKEWLDCIDEDTRYGLAWKTVKEKFKLKDEFILWISW